jgi:hypothetical protein
MGSFNYTCMIFVLRETRTAVREWIWSIDRPILLAPYLLIVQSEELLLLKPIIFTKTAWCTTFKVQVCWNYRALKICKECSDWIILPKLTNQNNSIIRTLKWIINKKEFLYSVCNGFFQLYVHDFCSTWNTYCSTWMGPNSIGSLFVNCPIRRTVTVKTHNIYKKQHGAQRLKYRCVEITECKLYMQCGSQLISVLSNIFQF